MIFRLPSDGNSYQNETTKKSSMFEHKGSVQHSKDGKEEQKGQKISKQNRKIKRNSLLHPTENLLCSCKSRNRTFILQSVVTFWDSTKSKKTNKQTKTKKNPTEGTMCLKNIILSDLYNLNPYPPRYSYVSSANRDLDMRMRVGGPSTGIRMHE